MLLYDFICSNNLINCNLSYPQKVNHTYAKGSHKSYIDHIFVSDYFLSAVTQCVILSDCPDNTSDHFPIKLSLKLDADTVKITKDDTMKLMISRNLTGLTLNIKKPTHAEFCLTHLI